METKRIDYFDIAKGIGIIAVVIGHMDLTTLNKFIFSFHMPLFFLISGYFLSNKLSVSQLAKRKAKQLLIPYTFTCICICILSVVEDIAFDNGENLLYNLKMWIYASLYGSGGEYFEPFYIKRIGALWFLLAMFFALVIVRYALDTKYTVLVIICLAYVGYHSAKIIWLPFSVQAGMTAALFVYIGYWAKGEKILEKKPQVGLTLITLGIWVFCIIFCGQLYMVNNVYVNGALDIIGAVCGTYIVLLLSKWLSHIKWIALILKFYGQNTLVFMCFHLIELNMLPWSYVYTFLNNYGIYGYACTCIVIIIKIIWSTFWIGVVNNVSFLRGIFSIHNKAVVVGKKEV